MVVVGAGHNGLICATYLARAGIDTLLVEARPAVGGCASTVEEFGARFNICNCDHTMIRAMPAIDELELASHGLRYLEADSGYVSLFHDDGEPWSQFFSVDQTIEGLAQSYPGEVNGYRRYIHDAIPVARLIIEMARSNATGAGLTAGVIRRGGRGAARLLRWSRASMTSVLGGYFNDWRMIMPAAATGPTVWGVSPNAAGTGLAAALYATRHLIRTGRPMGGSGALTDALARSFQRSGGELRCDARVSAVTTTAGRVTGVRLRDGAELTARNVVVAYDAQRVFVDWLGEVPPRARRLVRRYRTRPVTDGYESKIDAVLGRCPTYRRFEALQSAHPGVDFYGATVVVAPSPDDLAQAHARRVQGLVADRPTFLVNVPTVLDPGLAPPDKHVLSLETLFTPYALRGGWGGSAEPERWIELWAELLEKDSLDLQQWRVMTPDRYEAEFSMHRGHTPSYAGSPLAALLGRSRETTRYRTPIRGLYLTGAATFPGAGIFGASGRNTAHAVLRDRGFRKRRSHRSRTKPTTGLATVQTTTPAGRSQCPVRSASTTAVVSPDQSPQP